MNHFSPSASSVLDRAHSFACQLGHTYIGSEHLLLGLLAERGTTAWEFLTGRGITLNASRNLIIGLSGVGSPNELSNTDLTPRMRTIIEEAASEAAKCQSLLIATEHLLLALISQSQSVGAGIITAQGASISSMKSELIAKIHQSPDSSSPRSKQKPAGVLERFGKNLTASAGRDPVIGRDAEIMRLTQILVRKTKNNPCLIGEPGVGKTAIVEGLAAKIAAGEVPDLLRGKQIYSMELSSLIAGAKYRGEFEERMRQVVEEASADSSVILFIDELHTLMGAGGAEGAVDAANLLKPALARGVIRLIGATTLAEYRKIEKDGALERRFQPILVKEPTPEEALAILHGTRESFEAHHRLKITDDALKAAVELSVRYLPDRRLPDKALDLIDEAAASARVNAATIPEPLRMLEHKLAHVNEEKELAIRKQNFQGAADLREKEINLKHQLEQARKEWEQELSAMPPIIGRGEILRRVEEQTGIPVQSAVDSAPVLSLEERLKRSIVGQDTAIAAIAAAIRRGRAGLLPEGRPAGSFLFTGPSGVGKTELARALAEALFGSSKGLIRLDLSEYREAHSIARLIGAPPGYIGYEEGGLLTEKIRRTPYAVVLFDGLEKAHPDLRGLLLQILEEGVLTDSAGRRADFSNAYVIITSTLSADGMGAKTAGFLASTPDASPTMGAVGKHFPSDLLSRIDEVVVFAPLNRAHLQEIATRQLTALAERIHSRLVLTWEEDVPRWMADKAMESRGGPREIRTLIRREAEDRLAGLLLSPAPPEAVVLTHNGKEIVPVPKFPTLLPENSSSFQEKS